MAAEVLQSGSSGTGGPAGLWHYYAAVGNKDAKLTTLLELLQTLEASTRRPLAICCSSRDTLDSLVYALLRSQSFAVTAIHSDLTEKERELALVGFRRSPATPAGPASGAAGGEGSAAGGARRQAPEAEAAGRDAAATPAAAAPAAAPAAAQQETENCVRVLVVTDVCLKALPKELLPVGVSLVVEFDLPPTKDVYARRVSALFGSGKDRRAQRCVVIDMVEAGALAAFRALEGFVAGSVHEVPVRVQDMFSTG